MMYLNHILYFESSKIAYTQSPIGYLFFNIKFDFSNYLILLFKLFNLVFIFLNSFISDYRFSGRKNFYKTKISYIKLPFIFLRILLFLTLI